MNFLAHLHLAWPCPELMAGGLEGDFYKGLLPQQGKTRFQQGIQLHRAIDSYTDSHAAVAQLRQLFPAQLRRVSSIVIDLCFDHYLSLRWQQYHDVPLEQFSAEACDILDGQRHLLSPAAGAMLDRLQQYQLLLRYRQWQTIPAAAERIGQRFRRDNPLCDIGHQLQPLRPKLAAGFDEFYPELSRHCADLRQSMNHSPATLSN